MPRISTSAHAPSMTQVVPLTVCGPLTAASSAGASAASPGAAGPRLRHPPWHGALRSPGLAAHAAEAAGFVPSPMAPCPALPRPPGSAVRVIAALAHAAPAHAADLAFAAGGADAVQGDRLLLFVDHDGIGLAELHLRRAQGHGGEGAGRGVAEKLLARGVQHAHACIGGRAVAQIIEDRALGRGVAEALGHHGAAAGHDIAAGDDAGAAALAAEVDGVVAAGGGEAHAHGAAADDDILVGVQAVGVAGGIVDHGDAAAADVDPGFGILGLRPADCVSMLCAAPGRPNMPPKPLPPLAFMPSSLG